MLKALRVMEAVDLNNPLCRCMLVLSVITYRDKFKVLLKVTFTGHVIRVQNTSVNDSPSSLDKTTR